MRRWSSILIVLCLAGVMAAPAAAVDVGEYLSITGYVDSHTRYIRNLSPIDEEGGGDVTLGGDDEWTARTRGRIFFDIKPNPFSKAVFAFEFDQDWGDTGGGDGFDLGNDNNAFELKQLYVDLKIPSTPIRMQVGGFPINATTLKRCIIFCDDGGGIAIHGDWAPNFSTYSWFIMAEEELIPTTPPTRGEDWTAGTTFKFKPAQGIDVHLLGAYYDLFGPGADSSSLMVGACSASRDGGEAGNLHCFQRDQRFYVGIDAELKFGGFTLSPSFIYLGGTRDLVDGGEADIQSFLVDVRGDYSWGPLSVEGRFVYIPGNEASDDLADGSKIKYWQNISVTTVHRSVQWFEIMGWNFDTTSTQPFGSNNSRGMAYSATFDQFGLIHPAIKIDYKVAKPLTLTGAVGAFLTDEKTGAPARFNGDVPAVYNWTGNDNYLGTEFDVWLSYDWFKGTTVNVYFAYAALGDAHNLCAPGTGGTTGAACDEQEAIDQYGFGARMIYRF